jgi:hypothetical protein
VAGFEPDPTGWFYPILDTATISLAVLLLAVRAGQAAAPYGNYPPTSWQYGFPDSWDRIGDVLDAIESPSRRSEVAENWIQFSKSAIAKDLDYRGQPVGERARGRQNESYERTCALNASGRASRMSVAMRLIWPSRFDAMSPAMPWR